MKQTFAEILSQELQKREWSADRAAKEISRRGSEVSTSTVTVWANAGSIPNAKHGKAICAALGLDHKQFLFAAAKQAEAA